MASTDPAEVQEALWSGWSGRMALDVGARTGESIQDLIRCGFQRIICFEPSPVAFTELKRNSFLLGVVARELAISDHCGTVELAITDAMRKGELVSPIDGMEWSVPNWDTIPYTSVDCMSLDVWCAANGLPDFIKVDTEGHEAKVLDGARTLIATHDCGWLIEFHSPENHRYCVSLLEQSDYVVKTIRHPHYAPESHMWNQHGWIRAEKKDRQVMEGHK